jgi:hypothetical protein
MEEASARTRNVYADVSGHGGLRSYTANRAGKGPDVPECLLAVAVFAAIQLIGAVLIARPARGTGLSGGGSSDMQSTFPGMQDLLRDGTVSINNTWWRCGASSTAASGADPVDQV